MTISSLHATAFFSEIVKNNFVWTVKDENGFPAPVSANRIRSLPFWSSYNRVCKIISIVPAYKVFTPHQISLNEFINDWLPSLEKDKMNVGINWSGKKAVGYDMNPKDVLSRIKSLTSD